MGNFNPTSLTDRIRYSEAGSKKHVEAIHDLDNLVEALEAFLKCRAADGTKCAPNDSDFELGHAAIAKAKGVSA